MNLVESVFEIAESFSKDPKYVEINYENIYNMAEKIKTTEKIPFPEPYVGDKYETIVTELIAASINYCYFYGRYDIRPNNASSTTMYNTLYNTLYDVIKNHENDKIYYSHFNEIIKKFKSNLSLNRFPLIKERFQHLDELPDNYSYFCRSVLSNETQEIEPLLTTMVELFPGFASDIFLKRASLFFIQLYRRFGWFEKSLHNFFVPADYQIPKMLQHYYLIKYSPELNATIYNNILIPKSSLMECEIRSATILTIRELCNLTGWNVADIDTWFFLKRHDCKDPFHMTITTDY